METEKTTVIFRMMNNQMPIAVLIDIPADAGKTTMMYYGKGGRFGSLGEYNYTRFTRGLDPEGPEAKALHAELTARGLTLDVRKIRRRSNEN